VSRALLRRLIALACAAALAAPLAACGKKGDLEPPPGKPRTDYQRTYPSAR
jgi:predicted small lipoprotein YifL